MNKRIVAVLAVCAVGAALIANSSAAVFTFTSEAETGVLSGNTSKQAHALASGGSAVRFGTTGSSPSPAVVRGFMTAPLGQLTPQMLSDMKNTWDANVIRLQIFPVDLAAGLGKPLPDAWPQITDMLDQSVAQANAAGLKVIVDLHQAPFPGGVGGGGERSLDMWNSPQLEPNFVTAWTAIANKLKPRQAGIWGFDLFNEPDAGNGAVPPNWHRLAEKLTATIHGITPDIWVVFDPGPNGRTYGYRNLTPMADKKVIYTFHDYVPHAFTHQSLPGWPAVANYPYNDNGTVIDRLYRHNDMKQVADFQKKYNVPILVGEFSVIRWAPKADAVRWLQDGIEYYEANGWSWTYHAFREWDGWSLEHDENRANTAPANHVTDRGKVVLQAMQKNSP